MITSPDARPRAAALLAALSLATACGRSAPGSPTPAAAVTTTTSVVVSTTSVPAGPPAPPAGGVAGCEVTTSSPGTPLIGEPKSPYYDQLGLASTMDGRAALGYREVLPHASAPDGTLLPDGSAGVYYGNGEAGGSVWLARVTGAGLSPLGAISLDGVHQPQWVVDVDASMVDGKLRLFYLNGEGGTRRFCVAESSDGLSFRTVALAIRFSGTEADPTVIRLDDGSWLMAFSRANHTGLGFARSTDGLSFTGFATASFGVVPELALADGGRVRLYVCAGGNVESYTSGDAGVTWTREGIVIRNSDVGRRIVCDPSLIGPERTFVFKVTDA